MGRNNPDWFRRPELILQDLLRSAARGDLRKNDKNQSPLLRAVVLAVDSDGGKLQNPSGEGALEVIGRDGKKVTYKCSVGPVNPRGAVKARVLTAGRDRMIDDAGLDVFWPIFSADQLSLPISVGEHVYIMYEDEHFEHGLWVSRISGQDSANASRGVDSYTAPNTRQSAIDFFEENKPTYQKDEDFAGDVVSASAMKFFDDSEK